jgi:group I intron endonuclease
MEKKFNFVYLTTNILNGKQYVGDHSTDNLERDYYLGSGKRFCDSLKFHGKENFKREIIEHFNTKQEAFDAQEKYIIEYGTLHPSGYNLSPKGGWLVMNGLSKEARLKISNKNKLRNGELASFYGKHHSIETIEKISKTKTGTHIGENHHYFGKHRSADDRLKISETMKKFIITDITKKKLSESALNITKIKCVHCQKEMAPWTYVRHYKSLLKKGIIIPEYINKNKQS